MTGLVLVFDEKFESIKKYHHFRFTLSELGIVYAMTQSDSSEKKIKL